MFQPLFRKLLARVPSSSRISSRISSSVVLRGSRQLPSPSNGGSKAPSVQFQTLPKLLVTRKQQNPSSFHPSELGFGVYCPAASLAVAHGLAYSPTAISVARNATVGFGAQSWMALDTCAEVMRTPIPLLGLIAVYSAYQVSLNWRNSIWERVAYTEAGGFAVYGSLWLSYMGTTKQMMVLAMVISLNALKLAFLVHVLLNQNRLGLAPKRHVVLLKRQIIQ